MRQGTVHIYSGDGSGKSSAALGRAVQAANVGKSVVIIQFLKGLADTGFLQQMEPSVKLFRFEKTECNFEELSDEEKKEEVHNICNGLNFAKKVLTTGEYDMVILDEVLGLIDNHIISVEELKAILEVKAYEVDVIMTGIYFCDAIGELADKISKIETVK